MNVDWDMVNTYSFDSGIVLEDDMLFYTRLGVMAKLNLLNGKITHVDEIQDSIGEDVRAIFNIGNELYRIDNGDERIKGITKQTTLDLKEALGNKSYIQMVEEYQSHICVLYGNGQLFYDIALEEGEYKYIDIKRKCSLQNENEFQINYAGIYDNMLWIFIRNEIFCYDLKKWTLDRKNIPKELGICISVAWDTEYIYFFNTKNQIYKWNIKENTYTLLWQDEKYFDKEKCFIYTHCYENKIIILPWVNGNDIVIVDKNSGKADIYMDYPVDFAYGLPDPYKYGAGMSTEDYIYYPNRSSNYIMRISKCDGEISWLKPVIADGKPELELLNKKLKGRIIREERLSLKYYIEILIDK